MNSAIINAMVTGLLFGCMLVTLAARPNVIAELTKVECLNENPDLLQISCLVNRTSQNVSALYVNFKLTKNVNNLNGVYFIPIKRSNKPANYSAFEIDYCKALHMFHTQYIYQKLFAGLKRVSNFPAKCPLEKNKLYYVNGFKIDPKVIPSYVPFMLFEADATFITNQREILRFNTHGQIRGK